MVHWPKIPKILNHLPRKRKIELQKHWKCPFCERTSFDFPEWKRERSTFGELHTGCYQAAVAKEQMRMRYARRYKVYLHRCDRCCKFSYENLLDHCELATPRQRAIYMKRVNALSDYRERISDEGQVRSLQKDLVRLPL